MRAGRGDNKVKSDRNRVMQKNGEINKGVKNPKAGNKGKEGARKRAKGGKR